jgi:hypothetical protein
MYLILILVLVLWTTILGASAEQTKEKTQPDKNTVRLFYTAVGICAVCMLYGWLFPPRQTTDIDDVGGTAVKKKKATVLPPPDTAPMTTTSLNPFEDATKT